MLTYPNFNKPFQIYTDASKMRLGTVITQDNQPLSFYSRKLSDAQTRYTVIVLELLSIVETHQEFHSILLDHPINIYTDHKNLTFNNFKRDPVCHWRLIVEEYSPTILHQRSTQHHCWHAIQSSATRCIGARNNWNLLPHGNRTFPTRFRHHSTSSSRQQKLQETLNQFPMEYKRCIHHEQLIIYFKNKIVFPVKLQ